LVDGLDEIFSATEVVKMDEQKLRALGGESEQAQAERIELEQKVTALQDAQRECLRAGKVQTLSNSKMTAQINQLTTIINLRSYPGTPIL
jgi:hypothetical protein